MSKISKEQQEKALVLQEKLSNKFNKEEAEAFGSKIKDKRWYQDFMTLLNMLNDSNFKLSQANKLLIMGALAYIILPLDVVPDFMPIVGWLDDIFILTLTLKKLKDQVDAYRDREDT